MTERMNLSSICLFSAISAYFTYFSEIDGHLVLAFTFTFTFVFFWDFFSSSSILVVYRADEASDCLFLRGAMNSELCLGVVNLLLF